MKENYLEVKKSKFYSYIYKVNSIEEVDKILEKIKKENKKARHIVYAYKINNNIKLYSSKEPSGSCIGLINIINKRNLNNVLIVVVRYFGGTLLGAGLLTRSYTKVCAQLNID